jgi:pseudouridine synthase
MTLRRYLDAFAADECEEPVSIDGETRVPAGLADLVYPGSAVVLMHSGTRILPQAPRPSVVYALWKPAKCNLNMKAEALRSIAPTDPTRRSSAGVLQPIGRLDKNTTGLLLFTDDGILNQLLCRATTVRKVYIATVVRPSSSPPTAAQLAQLVAGVELNDGRAWAEEAAIIGQKELPLGNPKLAGKVARATRYAIRVVVTIGRNHVVKKLLHAVGLQVVDLHREAIAGLQLVLGKRRRGRWPDDPIEPLAEIEKEATKGEKGNDRSGGEDQEQACEQQQQQQQQQHQQRQQQQQQREGEGEETGGGAAARCDAGVDDTLTCTTEAAAAAAAGAIVLEAASASRALTPTQVSSLWA